MPRTIWSLAPAAVLIGLVLFALAYVLGSPFGMYFSVLVLALAIMANLAVSAAALLQVVRGQPARAYWQTLAISAATIAYFVLVSYLRPRGAA